MKQDAYALVLTALPKLTGKQRQEVLVRLRALANAAPENLPGDKERAFEWMLIDALRDIIRARGAPVMPDVAISRLAVYKTFRAVTIKWLAPWIHKQIPDMTRTEKLVLAQAFAQALDQYLSSFSTPVAGTIHNYLRFYGQIHAALERAFPGYIQNRWLGLIVKRKV